MKDRSLKVLALLVALSLALGLGAALGGGAVYALTRIRGVVPVVNAQEGDPESGIVIASVVPDGPAAQAGVVRGDILLKIDDTVLERPPDLMRYLDDLEPGDEAELTVLHGDDVHTLMATLGDRDGRPYLGLVPCDGLRKTVQVQVGAPGAHIVEVMPDSPAEGVGLREGDLVVAVDGQEIDVENTLADLIAGYEPGDTVTLEIARPGEEPREVTVELGEHPEEEGAAYLGVRYLPSPGFGTLRHERLPFDKFDEFDVLPFVLPHSEVEGGAIIRRVYEDSPAAAAGLEKGDVIAAIDGEPVESPQSLADALAGREPGDSVRLTILNREEETEREIEVTLGEHPDEEGQAYLGVSLGFFQMRHFELEEGERPPRFEFHFPPFDSEEWPFDEFDFDITPRRFEFRLPPGEPCEDLPGCLGDRV